VCVSFLVLQVAGGLGGQRGKETFQSPCFFEFSSGGAWKDAPPLFMLFQKGFPALLWSFEGLFCNF
jgi:hypothetical protein